MKRPILAVLLAVFTGWSVALAQEYPSRPIRFVVPYVPGGGVDLMGRLVGNVLSQRIGQPVIVENRSGGGGVIGVAAVANAAPDGYTVLVTADTPITNTYLLKKIPYDPYKDLAPLVKGITNPTAVVVAENAPFRTLDEGRYLGSVSTFYRLLRAAGEVRPRRRACRRRRTPARSSARALPGRVPHAQALIPP